MSKFKNLLLWSALFSSIITLQACTQKRAPVFSQGQGTELDEISKWNGLSAPITTKKEIGPTDNTQAQDKVAVKNNAQGMNYYSLVEIEVQNPTIKSLLGNPPFRGKANTQGTYEARLKLTEKHLRILKVAKKDDLPFDEHFYIEETYSDGRVGIPMVGYDIDGYYRVEFQKTADDRDSHHLIEIKEKDHTKATHVKIDWNSRELFKTVKEQDLFPSSLFFANGKPVEWYFAETVTAKSIKDENTIVGENPNATDESGLTSAAKVLFIPREKNLRIINVARDERLSKDYLQTSADLDSEAALIIPVTWVDRRIKDSGKSPSLEGETVIERKWSERKFINMNFTEIQSAATASTRSSANSTTRLLDIEVDQNYFSFTVMIMAGSTGKKVHYSFLRADQGRKPYPVKKFFEADQKKFGFFNSLKPFIWNWEYYTQEDINKRINLSRFNPNAGTITFHLSHSSPKWLEDIAEMSIIAWDKAFQEALKGTGRSLRVQFSKDRVALGDLRYNVIHIVDSLNEDGLLGFGPSIADPETGEIIAATSNVYANSIRSISASTIRQYIINRLENRIKPEDAVVPSASVTEKQIRSMHGFSLHEKQLKDLVGMLSSEKASLKTFEKAMQEKFSAPRMEEAKRLLEKEAEKTAKRGCQYAENTALGSNDRDIITHCPEVEKIVTDFLGKDFVSHDAGRANWEAVWAVAKPAIDSCSKKMTRGKLLSTLIHEVGHNLGLRHNFVASIDKDNFKETTTIFGDKVKAQTSSIMEYTDWDHDRLTETGLYDVAALRYGYGEHVELKDGSMVALKADQPISEALAQQSKTLNELKPYMFCTDEIAYFGLDALCKQHDAGTTPAEIAAFHIEAYKKFEQVRKLRRVQPNSIQPELYGIYAYSRFFMPLREIYDQWRYYLAEYVRKSNRYLDSYDTSTYGKMLAQMSKDPTYGKIFKDYYATSNMIYKFLKEVAFSYNHYCVFETSNGKTVEEFGRLRDLVADYTRSSTFVSSCSEAVSSPEIKKLLGLNDPVTVSELGSPYISQKNKKPESLEEYFLDDSIGNQYIRFFAAMAIHDRPSNPRNYLGHFMPNMTDDPVIYTDYSSTMMKRMLDGVTFPDSQIGTLPFFSTENQFVTTMTMLFGQGLITPNENSDGINAKASGRKFAPFTVYRPMQSENPEKFPASLVINNRFVFASIAPEQQHPFANKAIKRYLENESLIQAKEVNVAGAEKSANAIVKQVPKKEQQGQFTVEQLIQIFISIMKFDEESNGLHSCAAEKNPVFAELNQILELLSEDIEKAGSLDAFMKSPTAKMPVLEYLKARAGIDQMAFAQEALADYSGKVKECAIKTNAKTKKAAPFKRDLESQMSILLDVLKFFAD